jgi:putative radical SAM enzyme (TIGR03279 family)
MIDRLAQGGIRMHAQVVLCPGINDGEVLQRTVQDLARSYPAVQSVAVVPVGLTRHRQQLYPLRPVTAESAVMLLDVIEGWQQKYYRRMGSVFVHPADELYLLAQRSVPERNRYETFPQIENGVGMVRQFLDRFDQWQRALPQRLSNPQALTIVTGRLAAPLIEQTLVERLSKIKKLNINLRVVVNRLFGSTITVSGLLAGGDIIEHLRQHPAEGIILLPPNCLNEQGIFLDDLSPFDVAAQLDREVVVADRREPFRSLEKVLS